MKKFLFACTAALALTLSAGCATTTGTPPAPPITGTETVLDERALFAAEATYNVAANAYLVADQRNLISEANQTVAKAMLGRAYAALLLARSAYAASDAATFAAQIAAVGQLSGEVTTFIERR